MEVASIGTALLPLIFLACPVGMGLMMWFMAKGMKGNQDGQQGPAPGEVAELRAEQERLAGEVARLEAERDVEPAGRT